MSKHSLLLVDGDTRSLRVLEVSLRKAGFSVTPASSVQDALDKLELDSPDLIISETTFPDGDGFELRRRVRSTPDWAEIPFVFLTASTAIENKIKGLELGVDDYLTKPIYIKEIITRINILLQKKQRTRFEERRDGRTRFAGRVADMPVIDVIQTIEISRKSGVIQFVGERGRQAAIFFRDGKVIDAEAGGLQGEDAVYRLLTWSEGEFEVMFRTVRRRDVITTSSQGLLMEGMRRLDEWSRLLEQLPSLTHRFEVDTAELAGRLGEVPDDNNRILRLLDGRRTLLEVIDASDFGDLECLQAISRLYFEELLVDLDHGTPAKRDTGKPMPLVEIEETPTPMEEVASGPHVANDADASTDAAYKTHADATSGDTGAVQAEPEVGPLLGGYRPSSLRLIDEAVAAAQAIEPSLFADEPTPTPGAASTDGATDNPKTKANDGAVEQPVFDEPSPPRRITKRELPELLPRESSAPLRREDSGLRMIGSLGRDRAEASGELVPINLPLPVSEEAPQRELVTILPRRITREMPAVVVPGVTDVPSGPVSAPGPMSGSAPTSARTPADEVPTGSPTSPQEARTGEVPAVLERESSGSMRTPEARTTTGEFRASAPAMTGDVRTTEGRTTGQIRISEGRTPSGQLRAADPRAAEQRTPSGQLRAADPRAAEQRTPSGQLRAADPRAAEGRTQTGQLRAADPRAAEGRTQSGQLRAADPRAAERTPSGQLRAADPQGAEGRTPSGQLHAANERTSGEHRAGEGRTSGEHRAGEGRTSGEHRAGEALVRGEHRAGEGRTSGEHRAGEVRASGEHGAGEGRASDEHRAGEGLVRGEHRDSAPGLRAAAGQAAGLRGKGRDEKSGPIGSTGRAATEGRTSGQVRTVKSSTSGQIQTVEGRAAPTGEVPIRSATGEIRRQAAAVEQPPGSRSVDTTTEGARVLPPRLDANRTLPVVRRPTLEGSGVRRKGGPGARVIVLFCLAGVCAAIAVYIRVRKTPRRDPAAVIFDAPVDDGGSIAPDPVTPVPETGKVGSDLSPSPPASATNADAGDKPTVAPIDAGMAPTPTIAPPDAGKTAVPIVAPPDAAKVRVPIVAPPDAGKASAPSGGTPEMSPETKVQQAKLLMEKALAALEAGQADKAIELCEQSLKLRRTARTLLLKAQAQQKLDRVDDALTSVSDANLVYLQSEGRDFAAGWELKGKILWAAGRHDDARTAFEHFLELEPNGAAAAEARRRLNEPR